MLAIQTTAAMLSGAGQNIGAHQQCGVAQLTGLDALPELRQLLRCGAETNVSFTNRKKLHPP